MKATQVQIEAELEADKAQGFVEEDDDEEEEVEETEMVSAPETEAVPVTEEAPVTQEFIKDKTARKASNRDKRAKERGMEQFNLP